jgi:hypothetical protein
LFLAPAQSALVFAAGQPVNQDQFNTLIKEGKPSWFISMYRDDLPAGLKMACAN